MSIPLISLLVLNYRSPQETVRCIDALLQQTIIGQMEILLIDNHSDDESIGWIRARFSNNPRIRIIEVPFNSGYGKGNNLAAQQATGEYLLILNPDNTLPPDTVEKLVAAAKAHPEAGILGPALVHPDGTLRPSARPFPSVMDLVRKRLFPEKWNEEHAEKLGAVSGEQSQNSKLRAQSSSPVDWLVGACILIRTDFFRELGGFDPRFFLFFEDIDLCRRTRLKGKTVLYLPGIQVPDRKNRLSEGGILTLLTKKTARIHLASAMKYFWKWKSA